MSKSGTREMAQRMLEEARADVAHADQKASVVLAALGIGFGAILGGQLSAGWDSTSLSCAGQIVWWIGVVAAVAAVSFAAWAIWPRYELDDSPRFGVTYWGHVAALDGPEALAGILREQRVTSLDRVSHQLWQLSRLVLKKYRNVRIALVLAGSSGLLLGIAAIILR